MTAAQIAARLRECAALGKPDGHMKLATSDLHAAADLIESLHAEVTDLRLRLTGYRRQETRRGLVYIEDDGSIRSPNARDI